LRAKGQKEKLEQALKTGEQKDFIAGSLKKWAGKLTS